MKTVYLCCSNDRRLTLEAKASIFEKWELTDQLDRADMVAVVKNEEPTEAMKALIKKAEELNIEIDYFNENFIKRNIHEALLKGMVKVQEQQPRTERMKTHGRER